jgi:hypothetical protein
MAGLRRRERSAFGAGEGNRTLVFSLEVVKFRNLYKGYSDILQPSGRLRLLQNLSLSERGRAADGPTRGVRDKLRSRGLSYRGESR